MPQFSFHSMEELKNCRICSSFSYVESFTNLVIRRNAFYPLQEQTQGIILYVY